MSERPATPAEIRAALAAGPVTAAAGLYQLEPGGVWRQGDIKNPSILTSWITSPTGKDVLAPMAGELHAEAILGSDAVAVVTGVARETWRTYVSRGIAPRPQGHVGGSPWWARSVIDAWLATRGTGD